MAHSLFRNSLTGGNLPIQVLSNLLCCEVRLYVPLALTPSSAHSVFVCSVSF
jgi:hypothetical protein